MIVMLMCNNHVPPKPIHVFYFNMAIVYQICDIIYYVNDVTVGLRLKR